MLEDFIQFIRKENLFQADQKILLAVSGGIDSVIMSKLFSLAKFNFGIAHVNFSLRGEESLADEVFVKKMAKTLKVPYFTICFDTKAFAEKEKLSTQMAARILRYDWFEEIRQQEGYDYIATAHHQMDSAETVLMNLSRGSGLAGFHGIPIKNGNIIRPMAFASQEQIFDFVVSHKLAWREDSSNASTKYQRNFIRHEIIPKFIELNPHFEQSVAQSSANIASIEKWMQAELVLWKQERCKTDEAGNVFVQLSGSSLAEKELVMRQQFLLTYHFNTDNLAHILAADELQVGKLFESPSHILNIDRQQWVLSPKDQSEFKPILVQEEDETVDLGNHLLHIDFGENEKGFTPPTGSHVACLDADTLHFPLEIRKYQEGDWFCPLGMNQKKLISDFLTDKKVPLNLKKNVQLVLSKGSVVWVMGHRIDNRNKVTDKTEGLCILTLENK
ncbi:tRNA lysidine(34) synthetase TilS [Aquirufa nivalisilvae]|uniref:tRNA lysidine(34) synthetase TilS n=1 Tax=Aquirufa nivalisilvae TaxID=2516557 RepID=UPI0022A9C402|nr:tRNA lysidine(34) synthetase TilS [Aquirufa nivalisilvae]MCZ2481038.1 tRNA lysidine(34) synthetase TilS [Aquirufa nivalisilvae]MCZ2483837.1 tRNA lysidine(34) synthetase TilS [Aquirufa nivalisilvae]